MIDERPILKQIRQFKRSVKSEYSDYLTGYICALSAVEGMIASQPQIGTWIPCSERLPVVETEVLIIAKRKYSDGSYGYITTVAIYEDGTMLEEDSIWFWHDLDGDYDEEHDCYIIPEGWWEYSQYHKDEEYDNNIDDEVIAWMPLPESYKGEEKKC